MLTKTRAKNSKFSLAPTLEPPSSKCQCSDLSSMGNNARSVLTKGQHCLVHPVCLQSNEEMQRTAHPVSVRPDAAPKYMQRQQIAQRIQCEIGPRNSSLYQTFMLEIVSHCGTLNTEGKHVPLHCQTRWSQVFSAWECVCLWMGVQSALSPCGRVHRVGVSLQDSLTHGV